MYRHIISKPVLGFFLIASLAMAQIEADIPENAWKRRVRVVMSADTMVIEAGEKLEEVWLVCVRSPQLQTGDGPHEYLAKEARSFVRQEVVGKEVRVVFDNPRNEPRRDREARLMAYIYYEKTVELGTGPESSTMTFLLNAELIRRGLARVDMTYGCSKRYELNTLQRVAKRRKTGIWAVPPE